MSRFNQKVVVAFAVLLTGTLLAAPARAQDPGYEVSGAVVDSTGAALGGAMVVALIRADSTIAKFDTTEGDGTFGLSRLPPGDYILQVSFADHSPHRSDFSVTDADVDLGAIQLSLMVYELDPLIVIAEQVPFINKRDTLVYNARAFQTRPNAMVEELLDKLPGIEVDADGSIKAQGEEVENVLVEGKEFFGNDPKIATRNLPADAVDQVEVYDKQSDKAELTGIPDGQEQKTINLELKEEAKQGHFGRLSAGLGADAGSQSVLEGATDRARYEGRFNLSRFSPSTQLAVIANANNLNQLPYGGAGYLSVTGGLPSTGARGATGVPTGGGPNNGFAESLAGGLNVSRDWGARSWIRGSYFLSKVDNQRNSVAQEQQLLGSEVISSVNQLSTQTTDNLTHQLDLRAQHEFSKGHELRVRGNLMSGSHTTANDNVQETQDAARDTTVNAAATTYAAKGSNLNGSAQMTWRYPLSERGRAVIAEAGLDLMEPDLSGDLSSFVAVSDPRGEVTTDTTLQQQSRVGQTLSNKLRLSYTEPVGNGQLLEVFGERSAVHGEDAKSVFDVDDGTPIFNELLSSDFDRTYTYLRGGLRFSRTAKDMRLVLGLQVQGVDLDVDVVDETPVTSTFTRVLPRASFGSQLEEGRHLDVRYETSTREPSVFELQPFVNNTDPVNVYVGNPDLEPEYTHRLFATYRSFDQFSFSTLFAYVRLMYTRNNITQSRFVNEQAQQVTTPVNSDRAWSTTVGVTYESPIRSIGAKLALNYRLNYSTAEEFVNQDENVSHILGNTVNIGLDNRSKDVIDIGVHGSLTLNNTWYTLNQELNTNYITGAFRAYGVYFLGDDWTFSTSLDYQLYDQRVFAGDNVALWGVSISRSLANERAELQLVGVDLLNQNQGVNITSASSFIREVRTESLGRYMMLKFNYRLGAGSPRGPRR